MVRGGQGVLRDSKNYQMSKNSQPLMETFETTGSVHPLQLQLWFLNKFNT